MIHKSGEAHAPIIRLRDGHGNDLSVGEYAYIEFYDDVEMHDYCVKIVLISNIIKKHTVGYRNVTNIDPWYEENYIHLDIPSNVIKVPNSFAFTDFPAEWLIELLRYKNFRTLEEIEAYVVGAPL